jgi:hypothetical protein
MKMTDNEYLLAVLKSQDLDPVGKELKTLREHRQKVEELLRQTFADGSPTIRYGGSMAKGTMNREAYDLDIISYFAHDDTSAGETLEEIYNNVSGALRGDYLVEPKGTAVRLKDKDPKNLGVDFHIDVVPGRFVDSKNGDVFLYRATGEKKRLKTNLEVHIAYVKDSGVINAIRLMKLWRVRNYVPMKNFVLELLTIDLLQNRKSLSLASQVIHVWEEFRDHSASLTAKDPANPEGNDLSDQLSPANRSILCSIATSTLQTLNTSGWKAVFGGVDTLDEPDKISSLNRIAAGIAVHPKPYAQE